VQHNECPLRAGDIWDSTELPGPLFHLKPTTIERAEIRITRLADWHSYFILPLYSTWNLQSPDERNLLLQLKGPVALEGLGEATVVDYMEGIVGVHRTNRTLQFPQEVMPERYFYNVCHFDRDLQTAIVVQNPLEAIALMDRGYPNVLAAMSAELSPAQELFLAMHGRQNTVLINIPAPAKYLKGHTYKVITGMSIDIDRLIIDDALLRRATGG